MRDQIAFLLYHHTLPASDQCLNDLKYTFNYLHDAKKALSQK